eukprot:6507895-Prymnesium_polylepis.1
MRVTCGSRAGHVRVTCGSRAGGVRVACPSTRGWRAPFVPPARSSARWTSHLLQRARPAMRKLGHARRRPYRRAHQALADALDEPARAMLARAAVRLPHQANGALEEAVAKACRALEQHPAAALRLRTGRRRHLQAEAISGNQWQSVHNQCTISAQSADHQRTMAISGNQGSIRGQSGANQGPISGQSVGNQGTLRGNQGIIRG